MEITYSYEGFNSIKVGDYVRVSNNREYFWCCITKKFNTYIFGKIGKGLFTYEDNYKIGDSVVVGWYDVIDHRKYGSSHENSAVIFNFL